jgi:phosphoribosylamine--glycine ligase
MKVGVIGSGGRENAICHNLKKSTKIDKIFCFPGNAGTASIAENIDFDLSDFENFKKFILNNQIELVIVGPEKPLVEGIVDYLENLILKFLVQIKLHHNLRVQKYLQKNYVKNLIYQLQNLVFSQIR